MLLLRPVGEGRWSSNFALELETGEEDLPGYGGVVVGGSTEALAMEVEGAVPHPRLSLWRIAREG
ncbi:hypothetical protein CBR_g76852, partial [Chara braunii]